MVFIPDLFFPSFLLFPFSLFAPFFIFLILALLFCTPNFCPFFFLVMHFFTFVLSFLFTLFSYSSSQSESLGFSSHQFFHRPTYFIHLAILLYCIKYGHNEVQNLQNLRCNLNMFVNCSHV